MWGFLSRKKKQILGLKKQLFQVLVKCRSFKKNQQQKKKKEKNGVLPINLSFHGSSAADSRSSSSSWPALEGHGKVQDKENCVKSLRNIQNLG